MSELQITPGLNMLTTEQAKALPMGAIIRIEEVNIEDDTAEPGDLLLMTSLGKYVALKSGDMWGDNLHWYSFSLVSLSYTIKLV